jgi:uncharacterized membrane protein
MAHDIEQAKRPVSAVLAGPYGHPFHPILVTVPIGAWVSGLVFDIGSRIVDDPGFLARGSLWLSAIGVVGALAAALVGTLDLLAIPTGTPAFRTGLTHMSLNLVGIGPLVLSAAALAVLAASGYLGGKLAYHYGVRVAAESTQAEGYRS